MTIRAIAPLVLAWGCADGGGDTKPADCATWYVDADGDGFGEAGSEPVEICDPADEIGHAEDAVDCDDADPAVHPDADEVCDGQIDEDCDGRVDDDDDVVGGTETWDDADGDGFGNPDGGVVLQCVVGPDRSGNDEDCDDSSDVAFPGAAVFDDPAACMQDGDGDGYGAAYPGGGATPGTDCDDADPAAYPGGAEAFGDGVDQDCDGVDHWFLFDDFELGTLDPAMFASSSGDQQITDASLDQPVYAGQYALRLGGDQGSVSTIEVDATDCIDLQWSYWGKRGPEAPFDTASLRVAFHDGTDWIDADTWSGFDYTDPTFRLRSGRIDDPAALHAALAVRVYVDGVADRDDFYVDDLRVACVGLDGDGDGFGANDDCDDADPLHYGDCGVCVDGDGDGAGIDCDPGPDCDDTDPAVGPHASDPTVNGVDDDCDGVDGPVLFDDFEDGAIDTTVWSSQTGDVAYDPNRSASGSYSLNLGGGGGLADSVDYDASICDDVAVRLQVKRGESPPGVTDSLTLSWFDGMDWREAWVLLGDGTTDPTFTAYGIAVSDPAALHSGFRIRLASAGTVAGGDDFYVDDVQVSCDGDADGDDVLDDFDCAPTDPLHWGDCGACVDVDNDGFGVACDLGGDCDDNDGTTFPGQADPFGDGLDSDCNGVDGPGLFDDFEGGSPDPTVWDAIVGDFTYDVAHAVSGTTSLNLGGGGATATSVPVDLSPCDTVAFAYQVQRGQLPPGHGEDLVLEWFDGTVWTEADRVRGETLVDADFVPRQGAIVDPAARTAGLQIRFTSSGSSGLVDDYYIDDLAVQCGLPDTDGDGVTAATDCDDTDPDHWNDCGVCIDGDGDGRGAGCDRGIDCDDVDPTVYSGAVDALDDGLDADCNGFDGPGFADDFELGSLDPAVWREGNGAYRYDTDEVYAGTTSLRLSSVSWLDTVTTDTSPCPTLIWSYQALRGPISPGVGSDLVLSWWDGASWTEVDRVVGDGTSDTDFQLREGILGDSRALVAGFAMRLESIMAPGHEIYVDDLLVECGEIDDDLDGFPQDQDCDDADPDHWSDCGLCVDLDGDAFGPDCDLGPDCDDDQSDAFPGNVEVDGDGIDQDCDGFDSTTVLFDDFDAGDVDPAVWDSLLGVDIGVVTTESFSGDASLNLDGSTTATTHTLDTSTCASLVWRGRVQRGPSTPELGDDLFVSYDDGTATFVDALQIVGGASDDDFALYYVEIVDPAAYAPTFRVQLYNDSVSTGFDDYYVDDFGVGCSDPDLDGDGLPGAVDCAPLDPLHWSDCGTCTDLDGDGYGVGCDLVGDCDDADATAYLGAPDLPGDGVDSDCSGVDGPGFFDDFEDGAPDIGIWSSMDEEFTYETDQAYAGTTSLRLEGNATAVSQTTDTSACTSVVWSYAAQRGPEAPENFDDVFLDYWDGKDWVEADALLGDGTVDGAFRIRSGTISTLSALIEDFQIRLESSMSTFGDEVFVDDLRVVCGIGDLDGDGVDGALDCDDADPWHWGDCGICVDLDLDGYGDACDLGRDCADDDSGVHPGVADPYGDGIDVDCDGYDGEALADDFELGIPDPAVWEVVDGPVVIDATTVGAGAFSLNLDAGVLLETGAVDTSVCPSIVWRYLGKRGPGTPTAGEDLELSYDDGTNWVVVDTFVGENVADDDFSLRFGTIADPGAAWAGFRARLENTATFSNSDFYVDDFAVACSEPDVDGDGFPGVLDCDPASADHWADCGVCTDGDGDGYGTGCDLGPDCNDLDAAVSPEGADPFGDGADTDCDGFDGEGLFDGFELGAPDPAVWSLVDGIYLQTVSAQAATGTWSQELDGLSTLQTTTIDTTDCTDVVFSYQAKRGPVPPELGDDLIVSYDDGTDWIEVDRLAGDGSFDADFVQRFGILTDPAAIWGGFRIQFETTSSFPFDEFLIDDVTVACSAPDVDGDEVPPLLDCDTGDPAHWFDCDVCGDLDGDGFGPDCDLGDDCDDFDGTIYPGAPDPFGDGFDADCSGVDGVGIFDDFEDGAPAPGIWGSIAGGYAYTTAYAYTGATSLQLTDTTTAELRPMDTSTCASVLWSYQGKRGPDAPEANDALVLSWFDGVDWIDADAFAGDGTVDPDFVLREGVVSDPAILGPDTRVRLQVAGLDFFDDFYVDDLFVGCGLGDADGDGIDGALDCDDSDPAHWDDCGACVDVDGDDYGLGCDLGEDCDDGSASTYPGAPDLFGDGLDTDCGGLDGVGIFDDFEAGTPASWWTMAGDYAFDGVEVWSGSYSLDLAGGGGEATTIPMDTSACLAVDWSMWVQRGPDAPSVGDTLTLAYDDGISWAPILTVDGTGVSDAGFVQYAGTLVDPAALQPGVRFRLASVGMVAGLDDFYIDDVSIRCP